MLVVLVGWKISLMLLLHVKVLSLQLHALFRTVIVAIIEEEIKEEEEEKEKGLVKESFDLPIEESNKLLSLPTTREVSITIRL